MNHTYSTEFCEPCDSAYRSYACMIAPPDNEDVNQIPLSSTDSPETYYTGSGTPVEPDEHITNKCPSCGWKSLFIGSGGWITCGNITDCKYPSLEDAIQAKVDAAVAEKDYEIEQAFIAGFAASGEGYNGELLRDRGEFDQEVQRLSEQYVEQLKNKENHETTR